MNLRDVERRAFEIMASSILRGLEVRTWLYQGEREVVLPFYTESDPNALHVFKSKVEIPSSKHTWYLKLVLSGNALLKVDGRTYAGFDEAHTYATVEPGIHEFEVEASARGLFGIHDWKFVFERAVLVEVVPEVFDVGLYVLGLIGFAEAFPRDNNLRIDIENLLYEVLQNTRVNPSLEQIALLHVLLYEGTHYLPRRDIPRERWDFNWLARVYGYGVLKGAVEDIGKTDLEVVRGEAEKVKRKLWKGLEELAARHPKNGVLFVAGHSHIDVAWLWPLRETVEKVKRTFSTALMLTETRGMVYVQSSAQYYEWIEEMDKHLFERIRVQVNRGKWIPVGGMWVESDTNIVEGESLARQFLYGQRYYLEKFGRISRVGWLPDSFGFSGNLPQLMRKSGIEVFVTHKVMWNDTNEFPYGVFKWIGVDGSSVLAQILVTGYDEPATPASVNNYWSKYRQKSKVPVALYIFGYGDGGGGPTEEMVKFIEFVNKLPSTPRIRVFNEDSYVEYLKMYESHLPEWHGELYLEFHRGVYTTNVEIKGLVAEAEAALVTVEAVGAVAELLTGKPRLELWNEVDKMWKRLLVSEFHDILPGSSTKEVYEEVGKELRKLLSWSREVVNEVTSDLVKPGNSSTRRLAIFTILPWRYNTILRVPRQLGVPVGAKCQEVEGEFLVHLEVGPLGYRTYEVSGNNCSSQDGDVRIGRTGQGLIIKNDYLELLIGRDGNVSSLKIKGGPELLREPAKLVVHDDKPGVFDAWEVTSDFLVQGVEMTNVDEPKVSVEGPLMSCVEISKGFEKSRIDQRICVYAGIPVVEVRNKVSWWSKSVLVKHWFRTTIDADEAVYEIPFGAIERSSRRETSVERAMFEAPALKWVDVSDGEKGLTIVAPTRHGYSVTRGDIGLSIIRSPVFPNPWSDLGHFEIVYYLYPHLGDYVEAQVPRIARELTYKPSVVPVKGVFESSEILSIEPPLAILTAFKRSYDRSGYVARIYNPYNVPISLRIKLGFRARRILEVDLIELNTFSVLAVNTDQFDLSLAPFEIKTIKLETMTDLR